MTDIDETERETERESVERYIEYLTLAELRAADVNPKAHDREGIAASLDRFGVIETIVMDERTGKLISGHGRSDTLTDLEASYLEQIEAGVEPDVKIPEGITVSDDGTFRVPVTRGWASLNDDEAEAALIAVNAIGEGRWDQHKLYAALDRQRGDLTGMGYNPDQVQDLARTLGVLAQKGTDFLHEFTKSIPGVDPPTAKDKEADGSHLAGTAKVSDPRVVMEFPMTIEERRELMEMLGAAKTTLEVDTLSEALLGVVRSWASPVTASAASTRPS